MQKCTGPDGEIPEQLFAYVRFDPEHVRFEPDPKQNEHFRTIMAVHGCTEPEPEPEVVCIFAQVWARWGWGRGALFPPPPIPGFS